MTFWVIHPYILWNPTDAEHGRPPWWNAVLKIVPFPLGVLFAILVAGSLLLAFRHFRTGRGHRQGAFRIAVFVLVLSVLSSALFMHHFPLVWYEWVRGLVLLALALLEGAKIWIFHMALEPIVRRFWPEVIGIRPDSILDAFNAFNFALYPRPVLFSFRDNFNALAAVFLVGKGRGVKQYRIPTPGLAGADHRSIRGMIQV